MIKEVNKPEPEKKQEIVPVITKPKRKYISLTTEEVNDLIDSYRVVLKKEPSDRDSLIDKIEELEEELKFRSKLPKSSKE